jgi:hypothetical protein
MNTAPRMYGIMAKDPTFVTLESKRIIKETMPENVPYFMKGITHRFKMLNKYQIG